MSEELHERKIELKRKILTMEWDLKRNQLHFAKQQKLSQYKEELQQLEAGDEIVQGNQDRLVQ